MSIEDYDLSLLRSLTIEDFQNELATKKGLLNEEYPSENEDLMDIDASSENEARETEIINVETGERANNGKRDSYEDNERKGRLLADNGEEVTTKEDCEKRNRQDEQVGADIGTNSAKKQQIEEVKSAVEEEGTGKERKQEKEGVMAALSHKLLSPTELGAQLAVMPFKKTSDGCNETNYDYEVDTRVADTTAHSGFERSPGGLSSVDSGDTGETRNESRLRNGNIEAFLAKDSGKRSNSAEDDSEYIYNPRKDSYEPYTSSGDIGSYNSLYDSYLHKKRMEKFPSLRNDLFDFQLPWNPGPVLIHHHHYYGLPWAEPTTAHLFAQGELQQGELQGSSLPLMLSPLKLWGLQREQDSQGLLVAGSGRAKGRKHSIPLPFPWQRNSSPHEVIPYLFSSYLQLLVNVFATGYVGYLIFSVVNTIRQDINHKFAQQISNSLVEILACKRSYYENSCEPSVRVPALDDLCSHWEKCMLRNPYAIGNVSLISAQTLGIILNSLFEPLSWKFLFFLTLFVFIFNFASGYIRAKTYYGSHSDASLQKNDLTSKKSS